MGVFSRLSDIVNSNLNSMLDRAEDPKKIIRLIVQEMEDTLVEVRSTAVKVIAERKELERRLETRRAEREEWQRKAELALTKDREDLARGALGAKARVDEDIAAIEGQLAQLADSLAKHDEDIGKLQAKLKDAKAREQTILARRTTASSRLKVKTALHETRMADAFARFDQVERALDELEGKVEAYDLGKGKSLADELSQLETETAVDKELAALKARLGSR